MTSDLRAVRSILACFAASLGFVSHATAPALAQDFFETQRGFVVEKTCDAYGSFKRRTNATPLVSGRTYPARGVNARNAPSHAFIAIAGSGNKWVALTCGRFADGAGVLPGDAPPGAPAGVEPSAEHPAEGERAASDTSRPQAQAAPGNAEPHVGNLRQAPPHPNPLPRGEREPVGTGQPKAPAPDAPLPAPRQASTRDGQPKAQHNACLPFFDTVDNPVAVKVGGNVDISPPAPTLDPFDKALVAACGAPGKVVERSEFEALLRAHPDVTQRIMTFTGGKVFADRPRRAGMASFIADLTEAWFAVKAFDHIVCGEPGTGRGKIGGMHFHGRYLQLQQSGEACLMGNYAQNEVVPGVLYTTGVVMRMADGRVIRDARKGYGLTLSGEDLIKVVTRAFAENPTASAESGACLLPIEDDGKAFTAVFVRRAAGIRTFYPDATPSPRDAKCRAAIALQ